MSILLFDCLVWSLNCFNVDLNFCNPSETSELPCKEDFVFDINAGIAYAPIHMLLIRSGVSVDQVIYFMSQPIIDDYIKMKDLYTPLYSPFPLMTDDDIVSKLNIFIKKII